MRFLMSGFLNESIVPRPLCNTPKDFLKIFCFLPKIHRYIIQKVGSAGYDTPRNGDSAVYESPWNGDSAMCLTPRNGDSAAYLTPQN